MATQRIEFIDAMRGFTMILVVYSHICRHCLGDWTMGWNAVFFIFRLPCFFFLSGWLFYQVGRQWNGITVKNVVRHKFMVQIIPTVIFLLLLAPPPLFFSRLGATKGGYWFTFALFEFFVIYILTVFIFRKSKHADRWMLLMALLLSASAFCYDIYYNVYFSKMGWVTSVVGFLSFTTWRYYLFFFLGTLAKKYFDTFLAWTKNRLLVVVAIVGFVVIAMIPHSDNAPLEYFIFAVGGILGMSLVFTFFRCFGSWFTKDRPLGRSLQYIGTRTLDIYLLHYFVLPRFLLFHKDQLLILDSEAWEFLVAIILALMVVAVCLIASYIIRLSPPLGHYLFGVKYERK